MSVEPQLEDVNLRDAFYVGPEGGADFAYSKRQMISWVICGGESGPGARPFNLAWADSVQQQCKEAGVAFFMKQVGSKPYSVEHHISHRTNKAPMPDGFYRYMNDRKGGDMSEWPESLRVREFPA